MNIDIFEVEKRLTRARDKLLDKHSQFSGCMSLKYKPIEHTTYAATDGKHFFYNPTGIMELTDENLVFLWLHEWLHVANLHFARRDNRKATGVTSCGQTVSVWNMATDYIINLDCVSVLGSNGFIEGGLLQDKYAGMSSEKVYDILVKDAINGPLPDFKDVGGVEESEDSPEEEQEHIRRVQKDIQRSASLHKGSMTKATERVLDKILGGELDYESELLRFLQAQSASDWSYRKVVDRGDSLLYPSLISTRNKSPVIAVDTSISITEEEIKTFVTDTCEIFKLLGLHEMEVIYCDWKIRFSEKIYSYDQLPKPSGGGGTDFAPVAQHLLDNYGDYEALIYYTDGYCESFGPDPMIPTLWVVTTDVEFEPPYGEVVRNIIPESQQQQ